MPNSKDKLQQTPSAKVVLAQEMLKQRTPEKRQQAIEIAKKLVKKPDDGSASLRPSVGPSPKLAEMLKNATPAQREQAIKVAAALLNIRAQRESEAKDGKVDLTVPSKK